MPKIRQHNNEHKLPHNVYMQVLYIIKDYERMFRKKNDLIYCNTINTFYFRELEKRIENIDTACRYMREKYNKKIKRSDEKCVDVLLAFEDFNYFCYIFYNDKKNKDPSRRTWGRFKQELIYTIAKCLLLIESGIENEV